MVQLSDVMSMGTSNASAYGDIVWVKMGAHA